MEWATNTAGLPSFTLTACSISSLILSKCPDCRTTKKVHLSTGFVTLPLLHHCMTRPRLHFGCHVALQCGFVWKDGTDPCSAICNGCNAVHQSVHCNKQMESRCLHGQVDNMPIQQGTNGTTDNLRAPTSRHRSAHIMRSSTIMCLLCMYITAVSDNTGCSLEWQ